MTIRPAKIVYAKETSANMRTRWRVVRLPVGPECDQTREDLCRAEPEEAVAFYERLRQADYGDGTAYAVIDAFGRPVYACS